MEFNVPSLNIIDLPPLKDPKGGSPKTPLPMRKADLMPPEDADRVPSFWKTFALVLLTANMSGIGSWIVFGTDTVKRHDLEQMDFVKHSHLAERLARLNKEDTDISRWTNEQNQKKFEELYRRVDALEKYHNTPKQE